MGEEGNMDPVEKILIGAVKGYIPWLLALLTLILLLVAAGIGVPLWILPAKFFGWPVWLSTLPETGLALLLAWFGLWASMARGRQPFRKSRKVGAGA